MSKSKPTPAKATAKNTGGRPPKNAPSESVAVNHGTADATAAAARLERVAAAYLSGKSQYEIARSEEVSQPTISRDLAALRKLWIANAVRDFGERQAEELAKVDRLESEAWEAWERSKQPSETTAAEQTTIGDAKRTKAMKRTEGRDGNPAFLSVIERCITKRCEILGLDAPRKQELSGTLAQSVIILPAKNDPPT